MLTNLKLNILLELYIWKQHLEVKTKERWYYNHFPKRVTKAMTLAEVLITLMIVGIVASMTIPTLQQDVQTYTLNKAYQKIYAEIVNATNRIISDNGGEFFAGTTGNLNNTAIDNYAKYLNYTEKEYQGNLLTSYPPTTIYNYKSSYPLMTINSSFFEVSANFYVSWGRPARMLLSNGMYFAVSSNWVPPNGTSGAAADIYIDVNGAKSPNMNGVDFFHLIMVKNSNGVHKILPDGAPDLANFNIGNYTQSDINQWGISRSCTANNNATYAQACSYAPLYDIKMNCPNSGNCKVQ